MPLDQKTKDFFNDFLKTETTQANDTKTRTDRRREFEARLLHTTPTSEIAAKIEAAQQVVWVPEAYVLFKRKATCRSCRSEHTCLDTPRLFLQQRKLHKDETNAKMFIPVRDIEHVNLPRRIALAPVTVAYCLSCFETSSCATLASPPAATKSPIAEVEKSPPPSLLTSPDEAGSNSSNPLNYLLSTNETEFGGYPSEKELGLGSESGSEPKTPASA